MVLKPHTQEAAEDWQRDCKLLANTLRSKSGVEIRESKIMLHVLPCLGLVRQVDNSVEKQFAKKATPHPIQVCPMQATCIQHKSFFHMLLSKWEAV